MASTLAVSLGLMAFGGVFASTSATTGCSSAQTKAAPDAAPPECNHGPFYFSCDPPPAQGQLACNTSTGTSAVLSKLPKNTNYPIGCTVNFVGSRDDQGDCRLDEVCKCVTPDVAGALPDAGASGGGGGGAPADAGDDAEAGTPAPPPQPPAPTAGVWLCSP